MLTVLWSVELRWTRAVFLILSKTRFDQIGIAVARCISRICSSNDIYYELINWIFDVFPHPGLRLFGVPGAVAIAEKGSRRGRCVRWRRDRCAVWRWFRQHADEDHEVVGWIFLRPVPGARGNERLSSAPRRWCVFA